MKTKIYLTILIVLMTVQVAIAQQFIYGDKKETKAAKENCKDGCDEEPSSKTTVYYQVDELIPTVFTTGNNTQIVCRLIPQGSDTSIVCSTTKPENGWGTMVSQEDAAAYSYQQKRRDNGANIYSIAFTDPNNGWAVGVMESYSVNSGVIFHTTDGGNSWDLQFSSGTPMSLNSVGFSNPNNGWANGVRRVENSTFEILLVTTDGGKTWNEQNLAQLNDTITSY